MKFRLPGIAVFVVGTTLVVGLTLSIAAASGSGTWRDDNHPPFNATAMCHDGTWSWSNHPDRPSACENRGGVRKITAAGEAKIVEQQPKKAEPSL